MALAPALSAPLFPNTTLLVSGEPTTGPGRCFRQARIAAARLVATASAVAAFQANGKATMRR